MKFIDIAHKGLNECSVSIPICSRRSSRWPTNDHFTRAGRDAETGTQSAVSMQIKVLEDAGVACFPAQKVNGDLRAEGEGLLGYARLF